MLIAAPPATVHWTTYVQTFAMIASTVGTFVYVWFTYHIMKWAVGQGQAAVEVSKLTVEEAQLRKAILDDKVGALLLEIAILCQLVPLLGTDAEAAVPYWLSERKLSELVTRLHELRNSQVDVELRQDLVLLQREVGAMLMRWRRMESNTGDSFNMRDEIKASAHSIHNLVSAMPRLRDVAFDVVP